MPTDCFVLRTPTILPNIRISWDYQSVQFCGSMPGLHTFLHLVIDFIRTNFVHTEEYNRDKCERNFQRSGTGMYLVKGWIFLRMIIQYELLLIIVPVRQCVPGRFLLVHEASDFLHLIR